MRKNSQALRSFSLVLSFLLITGFTFPSAVSSREIFETYPVAGIPWGSTVTLTSTLYRVEGYAAVSPDFGLTFSVVSQYGTYQPVGLRKLAILLKEIELIRQMKTKQSAGEVAQGAADSVANIGRGFELIATHPVKTVANVGRATGELFKKGGRFFQKKKHKTVKKPSFKERIFQGARRDVANEFKADVYTENPGLLSELGRIAGSRAGGSTAFAVAGFFVPITLIGSVALTAGGVSSSADQMVSTKDPWELYDLNRAAFKAMGLDDEKIDKFLLDNPYYNPREQTRVRFYLEALNSVRGWKDVFVHLAGAESEKEAEQNRTALEMLMGLVAKKEEFAEIRFRNGNLFGIASGKRVFVFWPYDFVFMNEKAVDLIAQAEDLKKQSGSEHVRVLNLGLMTALARSRLESAGIKVTDGIFFKKELDKDEFSRGADAS